MGPPRGKTRPRGTCVLLILLAAACLASGATLSGPSQTANPGDTVPVTLSLASGGQVVSGVQLDLAWDPAFDLHMVPGNQAGVSNKLLTVSLLQPRVLRCLIVGMNQSALADGDLLRLYLSINANASIGSSQVRVLNATATGPNGEPIFLQSGIVAVQVQSGASSQGLPASGVVNGASLQSGPISPGEVVTLFGSIPAGSPTVLFNNVPATVLYGGLDQINAVVPFGLDITRPAQIVVQQNGTSLTTTVPVAAASPAVFTLSTTGVGPGAILNQDYTVNSVARPAAPGSTIMIYGTGFGALSPLPVDGQIARLLASTPAAVTATIDGIPAQVSYAGTAPTLINGAVQVNVQIPPGAHTNSAAPLSLVMGSFAIPTGVTVAIQ
jgi:uncharacterized protein (TIGR03437 family)